LGETLINEFQGAFQLKLYSWTKWSC